MIPLPALKTHCACSSHSNFAMSYKLSVTYYLLPIRHNTDPNKVWLASGSLQSREHSPFNFHLLGNLKHNVI